LKKAGLNAGDAWFCGDNIKADVEGSAAVGIFPVWYEGETQEIPETGAGEAPETPETDAGGLQQEEAGGMDIRDENGSAVSYFSRRVGAAPDCEHLHIHDWNEMIVVLEGLK